MDGRINSRWTIGIAAGQPRYHALRLLCVAILTFTFLVRPGYAQTPSTLTTVAGGGPQNVPAALANIADATSMVRDSNGNIYIAVKRRVLKYDAATQTVSVVAGTGFEGSTGDGGPAALATFRGSLSLSLDLAEQSLYISDSDSRVVRQVYLATGTIHNSVPRSVTASLMSLRSITVRSTGTAFQGDVYMADAVGCRIWVFSSGYIAPYAGSGVCEGSIDGPGGDPADDYVQGAHPLNTPLHPSLGDIQFDHDRGHLYFVERARVRVIPSFSAEVHSLAGTAAPRWSVDGQGGSPFDDFIEGADARTSAIGTGARLFLDRATASLLIIEAAPNPFLRGLPDVSIRAILLSADLSSIPGTSAASSLPMASASGVARAEKGELFAMGRLTTGVQIAEWAQGSLNPIVGNGNRGCGDGQLATEACVPAPQSVIVEPSGNLAILESTSAPVRTVDKVSGLISTLSQENSFSGRTGDFVASGNRFYFTDAENNQILGHNRGGTISRIYGVLGSQMGDSLGDGGPARDAVFQQPLGIAVDAQGNLFVADSMHRRIRRIDAATEIVTTVAGDGSSCRSLGGSHNLPPNPRDGSPATLACLDLPTRLAFDLNGDLLVTEASGHRIRRITAGADALVTGAADEIISTIAGNGFAGYEGDGLDAQQARISMPTGIVVAPDRSLYFSDTGNRVVRRIDGTTLEITTVAGARAPASDRTYFWSDASWTVRDSTSSIIGFAQPVCLGALNCPPGAVQYNPGQPVSWPLNQSVVPGTQWIWGPGVTGATAPAELATYVFEKDFYLAGPLSLASILLAADDAAAVFVNGNLVGAVGSAIDAATASFASSNWQQFNVTGSSLFTQGKNTIRVLARNGPGSFSGCSNCTYAQNPAGVIFGGNIYTTDAQANGSSALETVLEWPLGLAIGQESGQHYLYFADSGLNRVMRIPIAVPAQPVGISIANAQMAEGQSGTTQLTFTVLLDAPSTQTVSVNYDTADDSATTADNDYTAAAGTLTFAPGETSKQITITVHGDNVNEGDEQFFLNLSSPDGGTLSVTQAVGTITDDDPVTISVSDAQESEGDTGNRKLTFTVTLSNPSSRTVVVDYATADDTATVADSDYTATSGQLRFSPGETSQIVNVTIIGDTTFESDESLFFNLSNPVRATLARTQAVGTILDDDPVSISVAHVQVGEGHSGLTKLTFEVTLSNPSIHTVVVDYSTADDSATTSDNDYLAASGQLRFQPGETIKSVTISVIGDGRMELHERFVFNLSGPVNAAIATAQALGTIRNDDNTIIINDSIGVTDTLSAQAALILNVIDSIVVTDSLASSSPGGASTPAGSNVLVHPLDNGGRLQNVTAQFTGVTHPGLTFAQPLPAPPPLPANFTAHSVALDIHTTAQISGSITICFAGAYPPRSRLLHHTSGAWVDVTTVQTAAQVCGQTNSLSPFVVGSFANSAPTLSLPADLTVEASGAAGASVNYSAAANDAEDGPLALVCLPASGSAFPLGASRVICTATDSDAASASGNFTVTVQDTTAPALSLPANIAVTAASASGANVSYTATASDAVSGPVAPLCTPVSGALFPVGVTTVNCTAADGAGNSASGSFTVTVNAAPAGPPRIAGTIAAKGRDANGNYFVDVRLSNTGSGPAHNLRITGITLRTLMGTGTVTFNASLSGALPMQAGSIAVGANATVRVYLNLPTSVTRFSITENGTMQDAAGAALSFTASQSVIP